MNSKKSLRVLLVIGVAALLAGAAIAGEEAVSRVRFDIEAQPVMGALKQFADQTGLQVVFRDDSAVMQGLKAPRVAGELTPDEALGQLLGNTRLRYEFVNARTVRIMEGSEAGRAEPGAGKDARVAQGEGSEKPGEVQKESGEKDELTEIVVTAQKRVERIQDVPVPVAVINAESLVETSQLRLQDFYTEVPSLNLQQSIQSGQNLFIRGLPTSTFLLDDVRVPGTPDIDPGNLQRVEVLRGPQGTLYGGSGLGGVLKFVTIDPSSDAVSGRVEAGTNASYNGYDLGYNVRGSVNLPLSGQFALRAGAFWRQDPGYVDNPVLGIGGINRDSAEGGQLTALWRPMESVSLRLNALYQDIKGGNTDVTPIDPVSATNQPLAHYQQSHTTGMGPYDRKLQSYSAVLKANVRGAEVTSLTGYNVSSVHDYYDGTPFLVQPEDFHVSGAPIYSTAIDNVLSEEIRVTKTIGRNLDFLLGGYYSHNTGTSSQDIFATDGVTGAVEGSLGLYQPTGSSKEYAAFANLTYRFTDRFDVQIGGRASHYLADGGTNYNGSVLFPTLHNSSSPDTYLLTPRLKITKDSMLYARFASGFIAGGANGAAGAPPEYGPEKTNNYEIGAKSDFWEGKVSIDASVYYIDFTGLQLPYSAGGISYTANAGQAKSQGVELSVALRPTSGLQIAGWVAYDDAVLTQVAEGVLLAGGAAPAGARLPESARFSSHISVDQEFRLRDRMTAFAGVSVDYLGEREGTYPPPTSPRLIYPAYAKTDLHLGVRMEPWTATLYATNLTNRYGVISSDEAFSTTTSPVNQLYIIRPRTLGLTVSRRF